MKILPIYFLLLASISAAKISSELISLDKVDTILVMENIRAERHPTQKDEDSLLSSIAIQCKGVVLESTFKVRRVPGPMTSYCSSKCYNWTISGSAVCIKD